MAEAYRRAGHQVSDAAVGRWVRGDNDPGLELTLWASERWGVSIDELRLGQSFEASISDKLADHGRRLGEVEGWLRELAAHLGMEIDGPATAPQLTYLRMRREVDELKATVDRLLRQKEA